MPPIRQRRVGVNLREILPQCRIAGAEEIYFTSCTADWRNCQPGDLFVATVTPTEDGHDFVDEAIRRGAAAVVSERLLPVPVAQAIVPDSRRALGHACQALAEFPTRQMTTVGVTGTAGKTVTSLLVASVMESAQRRVGMTSSVGNCDSVEIQAAEEATPGTAELANWLARMTRQGCDGAVVEMSSVALAQHRHAGLELDAAIITNLKRDHQDYHNSVLQYRRAKARILEALKPEGFVVINADDPGSRQLLPKISRPTITISMRGPAELTATVIEQFPSEQTFLLHAGNETVPVRTRMVGDHHVYNCLQAAAFGLVCGMSLTDVVRGLEEVDFIPGRMERLECGQPFSVFVDHARTPDALLAALRTAKKVAERRVICVFGPEGSYDPRLRPELGRILERGADVSVVTSNNAGFEKPLQIIHDVLDGYDKVARAHVMPNRKHAIEWALQQAGPGDCVLIAGKGQVKVERMDGREFPHDDREVARRWLHDVGAQLDYAKAAAPTFPRLAS